jgi:hypothetical protein
LILELTCLTGVVDVEGRGGIEELGERAGKGLMAPRPGTLGETDVPGVSTSVGMSKLSSVV